MRLMRKLIVALLCALLLVVGAFAVLRVEREVSLFDADMRRDHRAIALTLATAVEMAFEEGDAKRALSIVQEVDRRRTEVQVRWVWLDASEVDAPLWNPGSAAHAARERVLHREVELEQVSDRLEPRAHGTPYLVSYASVHVPDGRKGAVELAESLEPKEAYIQTSIRNTIASAATQALVAALTTLVLGLVLVGRPMAALAAKARRVGSGDLGEPLRLRQDDEIGELAREMNNMCERLASAKQEVRQETETRIAALEQLRHADRLATVGTLAAGLAHELGTPLNVVAGRAKMLSRGTATPEEIVEYSEIIAQQAKRMTAIIRQILDFARRPEPKRATTNLSRLGDQTLSLLRSLSDRRKVKLERRGETESAEVDAPQVQQALANVIVNAIHASDEGAKITLDCGTGRPASTPPNCPSGSEPAGESADWVFLRVTDSGRGMSEEVRARIFEPFFTTKPVGEGTGLGLSIAHEIVQEHGGLMEVESEVGHGTTFTIWLPTKASQRP